MIMADNPIGYVAMDGSQGASKPHNWKRVTRPMLGMFAVCVVVSVVVATYYVSTSSSSSGGQTENLLENTMLYSADESEELSQLMKTVWSEKDKVVSLSAETLESSGLAGDFLGPLGKDIIKLTDAHCDEEIITKPRFFVCKGKATLFGAADSAAFFAVVQPEDKQVGKFVASVGVDIGKDWNPQGLMGDSLKVPDWVSSLDYGSVHGNVTFSTAEIDMPKDLGRSEHGVIVHVHEVAGAKAMSGTFGLNKLNSKLEEEKFVAEAHIPLGKNTGDKKAWIKMSFEAGIDIQNSETTVGPLVVTVKDPTGSAEVVFSAKASVALANHSPISFLMEGTWVKVSEHLHMEGGLDGSWPHLFGEAWISVDTAKCTMEIDTKDKPVIQSLTADLDTTMSVKDKSLSVKMEAVASGDRLKELCANGDVPLKDASSLTDSLSIVAPKVSAALLKGISLKKSDVMLTLSSADGLSCGKAQNVGHGITVTGTVDLEEGATMRDNVRMMKVVHDAFSSDIDVEMDLYIAVFGGNATPDDVEVSLKADHIKASDRFEFEDLSLVTAFSHENSVNAQGTLAVNFKNNEDVVRFVVSSAWDSTSHDLQFKGALGNDGWKAPFGLHWMAVDSADLTFTLGTQHAEPESLVANLETTATVGDYTVPSKLAVTVAGSPFGEDVKVHFDLKVKSMVDAVSNLLKLPHGDTSTSFADLVLKDADVVFDLSSTGDERGARVTCNAVMVVPGSKLFNRLKGLHKDVDKVTFAMSLFVPIFDAVPSDLDFQLTASEVPILSNIHLADTAIDVSVHQPIRATITTGVSIKFKSQPDWIDFVVGGSVATDGSIALHGAIKGMWNSVFGLKGLDMGDAWLTLGFGAETYIAEIGLGGKMTFGDVVLDLNGYVDIQSPDELFLIGDVEHLSLRDLVAAFNQWIPNHQIDTAKVPELVSLDKFKFKFAATSGTILIDGENVRFAAGFDFDAAATLLGINSFEADVSSSFNEKPINVHIDLDLELSSIYENFEKIMASIFHAKEFTTPQLMSASPNDVESYIQDLSDIIPQLREFHLHNFDLHGMAHGQLPTLTMSIEYHRKMHNVSLDLQPMHLGMTLGQLIESKVIDIKKLLNIPGCITNLDCGSGQSCVHHKGEQWHCVDSCPDGMGRAWIFGCVPCLTSAECAFDGSSGSCCNRGTCQSPYKAQSGQIRGLQGDDEQFCGMCILGKKCSSTNSGCILGFCTHCLTSLDCHWSGAAGHHCVNGHCQ